MKKLLLVAGAFLLAFTLLAQKSWVGFTSEKAQLPSITVVDQTDNQLILNISVSGMYVTEVKEVDQNFQRLELLPMRTTKNIGQPELPMLGEVIGIPDNKMVNVEIIEQETTKLTDYNIYPFQTPTTDNPGGHDREFVMDKEFYNASKKFPGRQVYIDGTGIWRDVKIANLHYVPFNYNPATKELEIITKVQIKITFSGVDTQYSLNRSKTVSPVFYNMYKSSIINFESLDFSKSTKANNDTRYLIITNTEALSTIQPLVDWKNEQGYKVEVKTLETGFEDPQDFKDYITLLYESDNLEYVLMVGDFWPEGGMVAGPNIVPMYYWAIGNYPTHSDSWFTCLDGANDYIADLAIGRFVYENLDELELQIQKTMDHYLAPDASSNWAENSILVAHEQEYPGKYTECCEEIRTFEYTLQTPIFEQAYGGAGATNEQVVDYVNNTSCGIFNYRGHGSATELWQWTNQSTSFTAQHVNQLTNDDRLFVFFDVCCDNMDFPNHNGDCLAESFMKSPVASVAVNGAIVPSYTIPNHDYDKEMYKAVFEEGIYNIGYVTNYSNITVLNLHGVYGESNVRTYLWMGDASLEPWTLQPANLTVTHDPQLYFGSTTFTVNVSGSEGLVENALVCITNEDQSIYALAYTDASGVAEVTFDEAVQILGDVTVTASIHNHLPYQAVIPAIPLEGSYVVKESFTINDVAGNNDGIMDYGESILLNLAVKNVGPEAASNVTVLVSSDDEYVTFTDNSEVYGDIDPEEVVEMADAFAFDVANNIPDGHIILFKVEASDSDTVWYSSFSIEGHAPILELGDFVINDPEGNNNGKVDPGETFELIITVENIGSSQADNVMGSLSTADPYITINVADGAYGNIEGANMSTATYEATASTDIPAGHMVDFSLDIIADLDIAGSGMFHVFVGQIPVLILDLDPNSSSAPEIQTVLTGIGVYSELSTTFPENLNIYSSIFCCLGIYYLAYELTPDEGQYLADFLLNGGKLYMEGGDTWYYDDQTAVHSMFNIDGYSDGAANMGTILGQSGTFTEGMSFNYSGENSFMDKISSIPPAELIFENEDPIYGTGVAHDAGSYRTVGTSYEFSGLDDGTSPSTKAELMLKYMEFFDITTGTLLASFYADETDICEGNTVEYSDFSSGEVTSWSWTFEGGAPGTSTEQNPSVVYDAEGVYDVTLEVSDGAETVSITKEEYISVYVGADQAAMPEGETEICINYGNGPFEYTTTGASNAESYVWELLPEEAGYVTGNGLIAEVTITEMWTGTATLKVKGVSDVCGEGIFSDELTIVSDICESIDENTLNNRLQIYPNPSTGTFTIEFTESTGLTDIRILNILGESVYENNLDVTNNTQLDVNISNLNKGVYFAKVKSGNAEIVRKVVVK